MGNQMVTGKVFCRFGNRSIENRCMDSHNLSPKRWVFEVLKQSIFWGLDLLLNILFYNLELWFIGETPAHAAEDRGKSRRSKYRVQQDLGTDHTLCNHSQFATGVWDPGMSKTSIKRNGGKTQQKVC